MGKFVCARIGVCSAHYDCSGARRAGDSAPYRAIHIWTGGPRWVDVGRAGCPQHAVGARLTSATPGMHSDGKRAPREKPEIQVFRFRAVNRLNGSELAFREGQHCQAGGLTHKGCDLAELAE